MPPPKGTRSKAKESTDGKRLSEIRQAADLLKRASDPTRVQILILLSESEHKVSELCGILHNQSPPALSHHLSLLKHGRLIEPIRHGKFLIYRLTRHGEELASVIKSVMR